MSAGATELADLVARWVHVIAGIMWVGNSLLFNWLDRSLVAPSDRTEKSPVGTIWLLHSGGFYYVERTLLAGQRLPAPLHWFKWQAYTTWLSGLALLIVVYWAGGRAVMTDPSLYAMSHGVAVAVGAGGIFAGWLTYEVSNRFVAPRAPVLAATAWIVVLAGVAAAFTHLLDGRAAFLHVGAMLGTIMAGNVFFTIVPSQRELVASVDQGRSDRLAALSAHAKRVSIHNNYFTFPVIALMISGHFSSLYAEGRAFSSLMLLVAAGATVRLVLNARFTAVAWKPALAFALVAFTALLGYNMSWKSTPRVDARPPSAAPVTFVDARHVIDRRCAACHSASPTDMTFGAMPAGVAFDTPEQIVSRAPRINERAVVLRTMPPANKTGITDAERALLGRWIAQGAKR